MRRNTVGVVWAVGLLLAAGLYLAGPDRFGTIVVEDVAWAAQEVQGAFYLLGAQAFDAARALAIGVFAVFVALCLVAVGRGLRARGALLAVSAVYLFLLLGPDSGEPILPDRWLGALLVAGVGALVMTRRLMLPRDGVQVV
ncbi:MAG: hypothetical protein ACRYG6_17570 [Janthinobacterium lividum]